MDDYIKPWYVYSKIAFAKDLSTEEKYTENTLWIEILEHQGQFIEFRLGQKFIELNQRKRPGDDEEMKLSEKVERINEIVNAELIPREPILMERARCEEETRNERSRVNWENYLEKIRWINSNLITAIIDTKAIRGKENIHKNTDWEDWEE